MTNNTVRLFEYHFTFINTDNKLTNYKYLLIFKIIKRLISVIVTIEH